MNNFWTSSLKFPVQAVPFSSVKLKASFSGKPLFTQAPIRFKALIWHLGMAAAASAPTFGAGMVAASRVGMGVKSGCGIPVQVLVVPQPKKYRLKIQTASMVGRPTRTAKRIFLVLSFMDASIRARAWALEFLPLRLVL